MTGGVPPNAINGGGAMTGGHGGHGGHGRSADPGRHNKWKRQKWEEGARKGHIL